MWVIMNKKEKKKTYGAKGEINLNDIFKDAIGMGVNVAIKHMMDDVKNMEYGDVYDTHILVNNINLQRLTQELEKNQNRREEIKKELTLLDSSDIELKEAIEKIKRETKEYQDSRKYDRNNKLNHVCNKILIEYNKNKGKFDALMIQNIIDESEINENVNVVVGYIQNSLRRLNLDETIKLHENKFDDGYRIKMNNNDVEKIIDLLDELKY